MRALNNYNGIMLLLSALNNSSIRRLTAEWEVRVHARDVFSFPRATRKLSRLKLTTTLSLLKWI
jgi:hypothetical protein